MKLRYKLLSLVVVYLICNALFSTSTEIFFANLIAHTYLAVLGFLIGGIIYIVIESDAVKQPKKAIIRVEDITSTISTWLYKPRPLLDTIIDLLTKPVARQRLIREANTGQLELPLDE